MFNYFNIIYDDNIVYLVVNILDINSKLNITRLNLSAPARRVYMSWAAYSQVDDKTFLASHGSFWLELSSGFNFAKLD